MIFSFNIVGFSEISPLAEMASTLIKNGVLQNDPKADFTLKIDNNCCELFHSERAQPYTFDFITQYQSFKSEKESSPGPLLKAIKVKGDDTLEILDATCGTGKDSIFFLSHGFKVNAYERHPIVYLLLLSALHKASDFAIMGDLFKSNFKLSFGDPRDHAILRAPLIYLDPMYPEKKKSSLSRKEMELFKRVVGPDTDSLELLIWARAQATKRVIVKRPPSEKPLNKDLNFSLEGKSVRYDIFLPSKTY